MKKKPVPQVSTALVPLTQNSAVALSASPDKARLALEGDFKATLLRLSNFNRNSLGIARAAAAGGTMLTTATILAGAEPASFFLAGIFFGIPAMMATVFSVPIVREYHGNADVVKERYAKALAEMVKKSRDNIHEQQRKSIVEVAEDHLVRGNLLSLEDAAWLMNVGPKYLEEASDALAITVLQLRKIVSRGREKQRQVDEPHTFASLAFDSAKEEARKALRSKLVKADTGLFEDYAVVELKIVPEEKNPVPGVLKSLAKFLVPGFNEAARASYQNAQIPQLADADQSMKPAPDLERALTAYEAENLPLDLPAIRGWKKPKNKLLASPGATF